ncbi:MAG: hypothetical protein AB8I69_23820, partial [Anaerolineae bacterium]
NERGSELAQILHNDSANYNETAERTDDALETEEDTLKTLLQQLFEMFGDDPAQLEAEHLQVAQASFGDRLFVLEELVDLLNIDGVMARRHIEDWQGQGKLFEIAPRGARDPNPCSLYSFSSAKVNEELNRTNRRAYYGYVNPQKASIKGLTILNKGLVNEPPEGMSIFDQNFHERHAHYRSMRPGSEYTDFGWNEAILGHDDSVEGASANWNSEGH